MNQPTLTCFPALEDSHSPQAGQASAPSPSVKSNPTARRSSKRGSVRLWPTPTANDDNKSPAAHMAMKQRMKGGPRNCITSLQVAVKAEAQGFIPTSDDLTDDSTPAPLSSQVDFLASHSALPGSEQARQITVSSGLKCSALCRRQDPLGSLVRTLLASSTWNSTVVYLTWKISATPSGRLLYRLVPSMPDTDETGCGLWPTMRNASGACGLLRNPDRVRMEIKRDQRSKQHRLEDAVAALLPTPSARDWKSSNASQETMEGNSRLLNEVVTGGQGGSLNPTWVEWLMGYPSEWTALKDSEMPSCPKSHSKSSKQSGS